MPVKMTQYGDYIQFTEWERETKNEDRQRPKTRASRVHATRYGLRLHKSRRIDSLRRSRTILVRRVLCAIEEFGNPLFFTLTFNDAKSEGARSASVGGLAVARFLRRLRDVYPKSESVIVPELSKGFRIHYHGLLFGVPESVGDVIIDGRTVALGSERSDRLLAKAFAVGFVDCRRTDGSPNLAGYLGKYLTKAYGEPLFSRHRLIRTTRGIPHPYVHTGPLAKYLMDKYNRKEELFKVQSLNKFLGLITIKKYKI